MQKAIWKAEERTGRNRLDDLANVCRLEFTANVRSRVRKAVTGKRLKDKIACS